MKKSPLFSIFHGLKTQHGQSLVEMMVAIGLMAIVLPVIYTALYVSRQGKAQEIQRLQAGALIREAREAVRSVREKGWSNIATNGTFYPSITSSTWSLTSGAQSINGFTRQLVISDVRRDNTGKIVTSGGNVDPSTKKIDYSVSWSTPVAQTLQLSEYLDRILGNAEVTHTTQAQFDAGTLTGVVSTNDAGGEMQLAAGGKGNWCTPNLSIAAVDLPKDGVANAVSAIPGRVIAGTGENASGVAFANINVTDTDPPTSSIIGTFDGFKTNDVFILGQYAYLATDDNLKEIVILDLNQQDGAGKYLEVGYFNASGSTNADSIYVQGNIGFMTQANQLRTFNLTSKSGSRAQIDSQTLQSNGTEVTVNGSYAFVSLAGGARELEIVSFNSSGNSLTTTGYADVNGEAAYDVSVNSTGTRAYLSTGVSSSLREFFIINTSSKSGSRPVVGSYESNGMDPNQSVIVSGNKAILVGTGGEEYQAINIANEANPVRCGGLQINTGVQGVSSVTEADGDAYSYIITGDSASELKIIQGGPGGQFTDQGTYISSPISNASGAAFNRLLATVDLPNTTTMSAQVAVAPMVSGSCTNANYVFVGPDATTSSFFYATDPTLSAAIPFGTYANGYQNPGQCMKYKLNFSTTDIYQSPVVYDVTVNSSP